MGSAGHPRRAHIVVLDDDREMGAWLVDLPAHLTGSQPQVVGLQAALMRQCSLADLEREYILLALEWTEGKKTEAADLLQIDRKTLYRKLVEYSKEV
jgi:DNA-binding NtrC family response regulator